MEKVGITCGTFDLFHIGHVNILRNAKAICDKLIVVLSTDELIIEYKKKYPVTKYKDRKKILEACKYVDAVIPQTELSKFNLINKIKPDFLFVGDDWYNTVLWIRLEEEIRHSENKCKIVYFPYTKNISTTKIRGILKND